MIAFVGPGTLAAKLLMMSSRIALAYYQGVHVAKFSNKNKNVFPGIVKDIVHAQST
jgi:hypothetical protein